MVADEAQELPEKCCRVLKKAGLFGDGEKTRRPESHIWRSRGLREMPTVDP
jgi:hypothetical protein